MSKSKKIILVKPISGDWERFQGLMPPIGLLSAVRLLPDRYTVEIFDQRIWGENWKPAFGAALSERPLLIGFTTMIGPQITHALNMAGFARNMVPDVPIIWGGIHPSLVAAKALGNDLVDVVVSGEGEQTLLELAREIGRNGSLDRVPGLYIKQQGSTRFTGKRDFVDLNELPDIPYHLVGIHRYI